MSKFSWGVAREAVMLAPTTGERRSARRRGRGVRFLNPGWKIRALCAATLGALGLVVAPAWADEGVLSYFAGLRAIGTYSVIEDVGTTGFAGPAVVENDTDVVGGVGFVAGARVRDLPLRLELEVAHRFRFDLDVRENAPGGAIDHEINVATTSALLSAIVEWRNDSTLTPFVGAGVGWDRNSIETERTDLSTGIKTTRDNDTDNFAWSAQAGVTWRFAQSWSAEAAYRYIDLGDSSTGVGPGGENISGDRYTSHDLLLGVLFNF